MFLEILSLLFPILTDSIRLLHSLLAQPWRQAICLPSGLYKGLCSSLAEHSEFVCSLFTCFDIYILVVINEIIILASYYLMQSVQLIWIKLVSTGTRS